MEDFEQFLRRNGLKAGDRDEKFFLAGILFCAVGVVVGAVWFLTR